MLDESNENEEGEQKQSKQVVTGEKRREAPSWRWHLRRDGHEEHPKIIIIVVRI
jgi:hypothetical protein